MLVTRLGRRRRRGLDLDAAVDEVDLVVALLGDGRVVGGDQHDRAAVGLHPQLPDHHVAVGLVELAGRLVGEQHGGLDDEGAGHGDALELAAGELGDQPVGELVDADPGEGLHGLLGRLDGGHAPAAQGDGDVLGGGERGHQAVALQHEAGAGQRLAAAWW